MNENFLKIIDEIAEKYPAGFIPRRAIKEFTRGLYAPDTLRKEDSKGTGPEGAFKIGGRQVYPVESIIKWLKARATSV